MSPRGFGFGAGHAARRRVAAPLPSTIDVSAAAFNAGWAGGYDIASDANWRKLRAYSVSGGAVSAIWAGEVDGTELKIGGLRQSGGSNTPLAMLECSIDGGAWATVPSVTASTNGIYTVFTGLADTTHLVLLRVNSAYSTNCWALKASASLAQATGIAPAIRPFASWRSVATADTDAVYGNAQMNNPAGVNFTPPKVRAVSLANVADQCNSLAVRGDFTTLALVSHARYVYVSTDGGAPVRHDCGAVVPAVKKIAGLSGTHSYTCWQGSPANGNSFAVGGIVATGIANIATKKRLVQFGDSITHASTSGITSTGESEVMGVAAALGYVGMNWGVAGDTIAQCRTRVIPTLSALATPLAAQDTIIVAIGRNNAHPDTGLDTAELADYAAMIDDMLATCPAVGLVICRGLTPEPFPAASAQIAALVSSYGDARVKFCDTSGWTGISTIEGVHPSDAGYAAMRTHAVPAYQALGA